MDIQNSIMNSRDLTLKHVFDIPAKLVGEQEEINNLDNIHWLKNSRRQLSLIGDETVINLQRTKVCLLRFCVALLEGSINIRNPTKLGRKGLKGSQPTKATETDGINGEPTEFEWNIFPGFTTMQLCGKVNDLLSSLGEEPETFTGRFLCQCSMTYLVTEKAIKKNVWKMPESSKYLQRNLVLDNGHWSRFSEKKWYSGEENSPQGAWDHIADELLLEFAESGHPIFRATTPLSRGTLKSKGHGKLSIHFTADYPTIETVFRIIVSANQLSLYGAVANICEEFEAHQDRSGEPDV